MKNYNVGEISLIEEKDDYPRGLNLKRELTLKECKYILENILKIDFADKTMFGCKEEFDDYKKQIVFLINSWIKGEIDLGTVLTECGEYYEKDVPVFIAFPLVEYLRKIDAID